MNDTSPLIAERIARGARKIAARRRTEGRAKLRKKRLTRTAAQRVAAATAALMLAELEKERARALAETLRPRERENLAAIQDEVRKWQAPALLRMLAAAQVSPEQPRRRREPLFGEYVPRVREAARPTGDVPMPSVGPKAPMSGSRRLGARLAERIVNAATDRQAGLCHCTFTAELGPHWFDAKHWRKRIISG